MILPQPLMPIRIISSLYLIIILVIIPWNQRINMFDWRFVKNAMSITLWTLTKSHYLRKLAVAVTII